MKPAEQTLVHLPDDDPHSHHSVAYSLDELHDDLDALIHQYSIEHPGQLSTARQPRRVWLGDMKDLTDDYPFATTITEALGDASTEHSQAQD